MTKPFAAIAEESAEASLVIDRSGQLRVGSASEELGVWQVEAVARSAADHRVRRAAGGNPAGRAALAFQAGDDYGVTSIAC